jgi:hypothetical protein
MTSSYTPSWAEKSSSYDYLRKQKSDADQAALDAVDDDVEYQKQQQARAAEIEREEAAARQQKQDQAIKTGAQQSPPNPAQEIGTAVVGAGIDAVESIGSTAEAAVTGQMLNPEFKPTWLQVADEVEPMNRTVWGNLLRGVGEYAVLTGLLRGAAKGAKAARIPGATRISQALAADKAATKTGKVVRTAFKGAVIGAAADFTSSYSEGETLSTELNKLFPQVPDWLVTEENDSPLERKVKNVVEGLGIGAITDLAFGWRAATKAAKEAKVPNEDTLKALETTERDLNKVQEALAQKANAVNPEGKLTADQNAFLRETDPEWNALLEAKSTLGKQYKELYDSVDPGVRAELKIRDSADRRQANFDEKVKTALEDDPDGIEPNAWVNSPLYDRPDKGLFSPAGKGGYFQSLVSSYRMENDGILKNGRRPSVYTESALEKRLAQFNPERRKVIEQVAKNLEVELNTAKSLEGKNNAMKGFSVEQLKALSTAKYVDLLDDIAKSPEDLEALKKRLLEKPNLRYNEVTGEYEPYFGLTDHRAAEMLIHTAAGELSDLAQAGRSIDGVMSNDRQVEAILNRMKFLLMETGKSKYIRGFELNGLKANPSEFASGLAKKEADVQAYVTGLKDLFDKDPSMLRSYLDILALADGNVKALDEMYKFAKDTVFSWESITGREGKRSAFVDALTSIMYNSVLSGPKTIMRAAMGTSLVTFLRPMQAVMGGVLAGDQKATAMGLATLKTSFQAIDEAWKVAKQAWNAGKNNLEDIPFLSEGRIPFTMSDKWKNVGAVIEKQGTFSEKAMYNLTTTLYDFNNWIGVKYPMTAMGAIDAGTNVIMGRMEAKLKAFSEAWDETGGNVSKELVQKYEQKFRDEVFDYKKQMLKSEYAIRMADEAGLKLPLDGKTLSIPGLPVGIDVAKAEKFVNSNPALRPFFMFMRTGYNALELVQKHTPILARFNEEVRDVLRATPDELESVYKYGITSPAQLIESQAVMRGRIACGYLTVGSAIGLYFNGGLTGNGPADRETRNAWIQAGWRPRSIRLGNQWLSYDSLEPFTSFLSMVADIGDNANQLGEAATENWLRKAGYLIAMNVSNKSFLAGLGPLNEVLSFNPAQSAVWAANVANNQMPWAGARNEIANIFHPGMRELDKDLRKALQTIANRNPIGKGMLPQKFDILDGSVVREFNPMVRLFNAISPLQINFTDNPTRRMLRESGYDVVRTLSKDSNGNPLDAKTRSMLQSLMGKQNIEKQLENLFKDPAVIKEMQTYKKLRDLGIRSASGEGGDVNTGMDVQDSNFYYQIDQIFRRAMKQAEAQLNYEYPQLRQAAINRTARERLQRSNNPDAAVQTLLQYGGSN